MSFLLITIMLFSNCKDTNFFESTKFICSQARKEVRMVGAGAQKKWMSRDRK